MQTRMQSAIEAGTGTAIGLVINYFIAWGAMTLVSDRATAAGVTVALCTVHSLARAYLLRRWFNGRGVA